MPAAQTPGEVGQVDGKTEAAGAGDLSDFSHAYTKRSRAL